MIYRPPNCSREQNLSLNDLVKLSDTYHKESQVLICGDFNFSEIVWEENVVKSGGQHPVDASNFLDVINDCFLYQHVLQSTHNLDQENESRLDLVFSRALMDVENIRDSCPAW